MPHLLDEKKVRKLIFKDTDFNREDDFGDMNRMLPFPKGKELFGEGSPKPSDVEQGMNGSCYLLGVLRTMAGKKPEMLKNMFRENDDGTVTIRFYQRLADGKKCPVDVTIDRTLPNIPDGKHSAPWVLLLEKAFIAGSGRLFPNEGVSTSEMKPNMHFVYMFSQPNATLDLFLPETVVKNNYAGDILRAKAESKTKEARFHDYQENLNRKIKAAWARGDLMVIGTDSHVMSVAAYHEDPDDPAKSTLYVYDQMDPVKSREYSIEELTGTLSGYGDKCDIATLDLIHLEDGKMPVADNIVLSELKTRMRATAKNAPVESFRLRGRLVEFVRKQMELANHFLEGDKRFSKEDLAKAEKAVARDIFYDEIEKLTKDDKFRGISEEELKEVLDIRHGDQEKVQYIFEKMFACARKDARENETEEVRLLKTFLGRYEESFQKIGDEISSDIRQFTGNGEWSEGEYLAHLKEPLEDIEYADPNQQPPVRNTEAEHRILGAEKAAYERVHSDMAFPDQLTGAQQKYLDEIVRDLPDELYRQRERDRDAGIYKGENDGEPVRQPEFSSRNYADEFLKLYQELLDTKHRWSNDTDEFKNLERVMGVRAGRLQNDHSPGTVGEALMLCRNYCEKYQASHMDLKLNSRRLRRLSVMSRLCQLADQFEKTPCPTEKDLGRIADERIAVELMNRFCTKAIKDASQSSTEYKQARLCFMDKRWRHKYVNFMRHKNPYFAKFCDSARGGYLEGNKQNLVRDYRNVVNTQRKLEGAGNRRHDLINLPEEDGNEAADRGRREEGPLPQ